MGWRRWRRGETWVRFGGRRAAQRTLVAELVLGGAWFGVLLVVFVLAFFALFMVLGMAGFLVL